MRRLVATLSVVLALSGATVALAPPASATITGLCGTSSKLTAAVPYSQSTLLGHYVSTTGSLTCGPYPFRHYWKVRVQLQQYFLGAWHIVATTTSGWRNATSGTVTSPVASVLCLAPLGSYTFRAYSTAYWKTSSTSTTKTLGNTYSANAVRSC